MKKLTICYNSWIIPEEDTWVADGRRFVRIPSIESHTFVVIMNEQ